MSDWKDKSKCLSSLAVFRELYDSKQDIYSVLSEFLKTLIISNGKHQFNLTEITHLLNDTYDFTIPEPVVRTSLKRLLFLEQSSGLYTVNANESVGKDDVISQKHAETKTSNDSIINNLFNYIEKSKKHALTDQEKESIVPSFCGYLLDEATPQEYSKYISAFIIQNEKDSDFIKQLNKIKEGVVLYTGIKYNNSNLNEIGSWGTDLTIYLETEMLFSLAGYNGVLHSTLLNELYSFINEINRSVQNKEGKKRIQLKYFVETNNKIENFFTAAEHIVSGRERSYLSKVAMSAIVDGCTTPSDVIGKRVKFYQLLQSKGIQLDDNANYYEEQNYRFNIEDIDTIRKLEESFEARDAEARNIDDCLKVLNYINILRKDNSNKNFENIGFILLTGNSTTWAIARDKSIKNAGDVPLSTTVNFLTNKFWFKLNKGFGKDTYPKTFDIITKAQIVIASLLNNSVAGKYDEFQASVKSGGMTEENAKATIVMLRQRVKKPEEVNESNITDVLEFITEHSIGRYIREQELFKNTAQKQAQENEALKAKLSRQQEESKRRELENQKEVERHTKENEGKDLELKKYKDEEETIKAKKLKIRQCFRKAEKVVLVLLCIALVVVLYMYCNKTLGVIVGIIGVLLGILRFLGIDYHKFKQWFRG